MKFSMERGALLAALGHVQNVVERRNTIPILSNVLISAAGGGINLTATDLDIEISEQAEATIAAPGDITVPAHTFYDIARKLPDGAQIGVEIGGDGRLEISAGRSHFTLPLLPAGDFPKLTADDFTHHFNMKPAQLLRLLDKTKFAISTEETRYYLNGIYIEASGDKLRAVATDGHRLALADTELPSGAEDLPGIIVPRKTVGEIRRLIDGHDGDIDVSLSDAKIRFVVGGAVLTSKLIDGSFPDYQRVIPKDNPSALVIENTVFASAVDRVSTISADKSRSIKFGVDGDNLQLAVNSPETGNATEDLIVDFSGDALEIGFNAKYLLDVSGQIESKDVKFHLADNQSPVLVTDSGDDDALFVLMPLRV